MEVRHNEPKSGRTDDWQFGGIYALLHGRWRMLTKITAGDGFLEENVDKPENETELVQK